MSVDPQTPTDDAQQTDDRVVSRRRMIRTAATATVAGTVGATAAAAPAQAAPGDPVTIDAVNDGAGSTSLNGSQLSVTQNSQPAAIEAKNTVGPQLLLSVNEAEEFPPMTGQYHVGAIVNWHGQLFQCVQSNAALPNSSTTWTRLTNTGPVLTLLPKPVRVYASTKDAERDNAKIVNGEWRQVDTTTTQTDPISGVPSWAESVVGTVQVYATETNTGYLAIGSGDIRPGGYSTTVWSAPGFSGVTAFTSQLGDPAGENWGYLSVVCLSAAAAAKTHFFVDIVGYYDRDVFYGGPAPVAADATRLRQQDGRAVRKVRRTRTR